MLVREGRVADSSTAEQEIMLRAVATQRVRDGERGAPPRADASSVDPDSLVATARVTPTPRVGGHPAPRPSATNSKARSRRMSRRPSTLTRRMVGAASTAAPSKLVRHLAEQRHPLDGDKGRLHGRVASRRPGTSHVQRHRPSGGSVERSIGQRMRCSRSATRWPAMHVPPTGSRSFTRPLSRRLGRTWRSTGACTGTSVACRRICSAHATPDPWRGGVLTAEDELALLLISLRQGRLHRTALRSRCLRVVGYPRRVVPRAAAGGHGASTPELRSPILAAARVIERLAGVPALALHGQARRPSAP